jgi:hypothetical protein
MILQFQGLSWRDGDRTGWARTGGEIQGASLLVHPGTGRPEVEIHHCAEVACSVSSTGATRATASL